MRKKLIDERPKELARRIRIAQAVADKGGSLTQVAKRCKLKLGVMNHTLKKYAPDLYAKLNQGRRPFLTEAQYAKRMVTLENIAHEGGGLVQASKALKISKPAVTQWLKQEKLDVLQRQLAKNGRSQDGKRLSPTETRMRLAAVAMGQQAGLTLTAIAKNLGLDKGGLSRWLRLYAPDGAADALSDYMDD
jgi:transposase